MAAAKIILCPLALAITLVACGESPSEEPYNGRFSEAQETAAAYSDAPALTEEQLVRVCRTGHGFRVGHDRDDMAASPQEGFIRLAYTRDDEKSFRYDCKVEGNQIRTRMIDEAGPGSGPGVWSGHGSTTTFSIDGATITIRDVFSDGSSVKENFDF